MNIQGGGSPYNFKPATAANGGPKDKPQVATGSSTIQVSSGGSTTATTSTTYSGSEPSPPPSRSFGERFNAGINQLGAFFTKILKK